MPATSAAYKSGLAACDLPRRNDLDGRGNLSEEALAEFTRFFLETCIDQVAFMEGLVAAEPPARPHPDVGRGGSPRGATCRQKAGAILEAVLFRGELPRGDAAALLDATPRHARRIVSALIERGVLTSAGPRAPLHLAFPAALASRWMPGLFPERTV